jgi:hypothetical protein
VPFLAAALVLAALTKPLMLPAGALDRADGLPPNATKAEI